MRHIRLAAAAMISLIGAATVASYVATGEGHPSARPLAKSLRAPTDSPWRVVPQPVKARRDRPEQRGHRPAPHRDRTYRFTTVTFAGSLDAQISGINEVGAYTGNVVDFTGSRPFVVPAPGTPPTYFSLPYPARASTVKTAGIDSAGGIAGTYADPNGVFHGFTRAASGRFERVDIGGAGTAAGEGTEIAGVSPGGVIVGSYLTSSKVALGFIDRGGLITRWVEKSAGGAPGEGTAVEFYSAANGYGGVYIGPRATAHGWYVQDGKPRVVDGPGGGEPAPHTGTQLVGVDSGGRLYGIERPATGMTDGFWMSSGTWGIIRDPLQVAGRAGETLVFGVRADGVVVGSYTYDAGGQTRAFIGRPQD